MADILENFGYWKPQKIAESFIFEPITRELSHAF
ncbi:hypothetical protein SAMN05192529_12938 [Arachidicoccus rhizosphaerae]|uniref:Uncharacterized protein n=1 Tax=Arachidicoccus rhizosphaerae TaxID=551991 RepID=A0A1H4CAA0_9BACT|nr:hypothetical protein SAMN05192529_12938 [Arachidicoccus rhizosphaerae]